ncbi:MAG: ribosome maturation factor RimM [Pseudomonadota bacterium]
MGEILKAGRFLGAFGIKGWVKVYSDTAPRENILDYRPWYLLRGGRWQAVEVAEGAVNDKGVIVRLKGMDDRNAAETLSGIEIGIAAESLPALPQDEFYWRDLIGLRVVNAEGVLLGVVDSLLETGANDVMVVVACEGSIDDGKRLVPWVRGEVVQRVDAGARTITVDWGPDW